MVTCSLLRLLSTVAGRVHSHADGVEEEKNGCFFSFIKVRAAWRRSEKFLQSAGDGDDGPADSAPPPGGLCASAGINPPESRTPQRQKTGKEAGERNRTGTEPD